MKSILAGLFLLSLTINSLFGSEEKEESFRLIPIIEVDGELMSGWESQIKELYQDSEGNPVPVVFRGAAKNWEAANWTPEWLAENFGEEEIFVVKNAYDGKRTTMKNHISDILLNPNKAYYYSSDMRMTFLPDMKMITEFPQYEIHFLRDWTLTIFGVDFDPGFFAIFIGSENSVTNLHSHETVFLSQMYGKKIVRLVHPKYVGECKCLCDLFKSYYDCPTININAPDFEKYPELKNIEVIEVILDAGDVLYIPDGYLHDVRGMSASISIASSRPI